MPETPEQLKEDAETARLERWRQQVLDDDNLGVYNRPVGLVKRSCRKGNAMPDETNELKELQEAARATQEDWIHAKNRLRDHLQRLVLKDRPDLGLFKVECTISFIIRGSKEELLDSSREHMFVDHLYQTINHRGQTAITKTVIAEIESESEVSEELLHTTPLNQYDIKDDPNRTKEDNLIQNMSCKQIIDIIQNPKSNG